MKTSRLFYKCFAPLYDPIMRMVEGPNFGEWRQLLWNRVEGQQILEVGVGTGRSFPFYPPEKNIIAVDQSENMLRLAREKAQTQNIPVHLKLMDIRQLDFADNSFDTVVSSLVFCEVSDPVKGLEEVRRVVRSGGKVVMLEHVISDNHKTAWLMNLVNPLTSFFMGENINRQTGYNVGESGLIIEKVIRLSSIFRLIEARKG